MLRRVRYVAATGCLAVGLVLVMLGRSGARAIGLALLALGGLLLLFGRGQRPEPSADLSAQDATPQQLWRSMDDGRDPTDDDARNGVDPG